MSIEEIEKMSEEERLNQLKWSDTHEFGTSYAYYLLKENKKLKERIEYLERSNNRREELIDEQRAEIFDLEENRDKAIEFIHEEKEEFIEVEMKYQEYKYAFVPAIPLLKILESSDSNEFDR